MRGLGPWMAIAIVVGTVIGSGVFKKPQVVAQNVPDLGMVAAVWILGGVLALLGALTLAEVAVLYPRAGGNYVFLREGFGRWAGFLWGWVEFMIIRAASIAALATMFTESYRDVLIKLTGNTLLFWGEKSLTMCVILALALINVRGVRWGGGLQLAITFVKVGSLVGILLLPWIFLAQYQSLPEPPTQTEASQVPTELTLNGFLTAFLGVLWAYHGWMSITPVAEEIRSPQRNIPLALLGGVGIVTALYLGANFAYHQVLPMWEMAGLKETPVATAFAVRLVGGVGVVVMSGAIMCSVFGALNGNLLVGPRVLFAMGEDGLVPRGLGAIHPRFHTPALAILATAAWSIALVLAVALLTEWNVISRKVDHFDVLTNFAMFGAMTLESMAIATIFVFRRTLPNAPRPYRCWGYPVVPTLYLIMPALVLRNMFIDESLRLPAWSGVGFIAVGLLVYFAFLDRAKPK